MRQVILDPDGLPLRAMAVAPIEKPRRALIFLFGISTLTAAALVAALRQQSWEYGLMWQLNHYARHSAALDRLIHSLTARDLLEGALFIAAFWYLWFDGADPLARARLLAGTAAATTAGIVSRLLQIGLPTHLRPLHTPNLGFVLPFGVEPDTLNHYNSFPSDHGAVYFGLAMVIYRMKPGFGILAMIWAIIVDIARVYDGYHYFSDIAGSIGLAAMIFALFDIGWVNRVALRVMTFEEAWRPWFYATMFLVTFQVATLFDDLRQIGVGVAGVILHRNPFLGG